MNAYSHSEPMAPFYVQAVFSKPPAEAAPNRTGQAAPASSGEGGWWEHPLGELGLSWRQVAAIPLFAVVFAVVQLRPALAPVTVLVLLACVLHRLELSKRRIALVPITLATLMLAGRIVGASGPMVSAALRPMTPRAGFDWLPLFLSVCLFYMPKPGSYTGKIVLMMSLVLLASGLLPGRGFEAIFITTQYFLFVAIIAGLAIEFARTQPAQAGNSREAA